MKIIHSIKSIQNLVLKFKQHNKKIGFIPTMGALHQGHIFLIRRARKETDIVVVSIFVNPTQFCPKEDFSKYPRPIKKDIAICKNEGVDLVFAPEPSEMYPENYLTYIMVEKLSDIMCGKFRPGHFKGVATIVAKLFNIVQPDKAYFGLKDFQQSVIIRKMVSDLNFPVQIITCPTVREKYGLALSSRNAYLTGAERKRSLAISFALQMAKNLIKHKNVKLAKKIISEMKKILSEIRFGGKIRRGGILPNVDKIDYIDIRDAETLKEVKYIKSKVVIAVAVIVGKTRLIDCVVVDL
ncbi:MAG: pantoate--beta-alanine ligase [Elusimicrobiota bacterium]